MKSSRTLLALILCLTLVLPGCQRNDRALVVGKIQAASDLATTEFTVDKIVHGTKTKKFLWKIKLGEARFLAYSKARIKAGVDLSAISEEDVDIQDNKIKLVLPPIKVVNFSYPAKDFTLDIGISDLKKLFVKIDVEDQEELFRQAEIDIRDNLEFMGIVETTQKNTRLLLTNLLNSLGYEEVFIQFKSDELIIDKVELDLTEEGGNNG